MPAVAGRLRVTEATPEEFVVAMIMVPVVAPFDRVPAEVENRMLAPVFVKPGGSELGVTVSGCGKVVPALPD